MVNYKWNEEGSEILLLHQNHRPIHLPRMGHPRPSIFPNQAIVPVSWIFDPWKSNTKKSSFNLHEED